MKRKGTFALLISLSAIAAMAFGLSTTASATSVDDAVACVFQGSTINLDDIQPPPSLGGHGGYDFQTQTGQAARCVQLDNDNDGDNDTGVWEGVINSTGSYQNIVCGTGHAHGHPWVDAGNVDHPPGPGPVHTPKTWPSVSSLTASTEVAAPLDTNNANNDSPVSGVQYEIEFVSGEGALSITAAQDADGDVLVGTGGGNVVIEPKPRPGTPSGNTTPTGCVNTAVTDFDVVGTFIAATGTP